MGKIKLTPKQKYIKEMRDYWEQTRGTGIPGTKASTPDNFDAIIGDYYDREVKGK